MREIQKEGGGMERKREGRPTCDPWFGPTSVMFVGIVVVDSSGYVGVFPRVKLSPFYNV